MSRVFKMYLGPLPSPPRPLAQFWSCDYCRARYEERPKACDCGNRNLRPPAVAARVADATARKFTSGARPDQVVCVHEFIVIGAEGPTPHAVCKLCDQLREDLGL